MESNADSIESATNEPRLKPSTTFTTTKHTKSKSAKKKKERLDEAVSYAEKLSKRGVIYISRVPPKMTVSKVSCARMNINTTQHATHSHAPLR